MIDTPCQRVRIGIARRGQNAVVVETGTVQFFEFPSVVREHGAAQFMSTLKDLLVEGRLPAIILRSDNIMTQGAERLNHR